MRWPLENSSTPATFSPSIVADAFGEVNEDTSKLIMKLARLTAKTDFGKPMSPLIVIHSNSIRKSGKKEGVPSPNHAASPSSGVH